MKKIGVTAFGNFQKDRKSAEIGYDLSPDYHRQGIMSESLESMTEFEFTKVDLDVIDTHKVNIKSTLCHLTFLNPL